MPPHPLSSKAIEGEPHLLFRRRGAQPGISTNHPLANLLERGTIGEEIIAFMSADLNILAIKNIPLKIRS